MNRQCGQASLAIYGALGALVVIFGLGVALKVQSARLEASKAVVEGYKQAGEVAEREAKRINKDNKERKAKSDESYKRSLARLNTDNERLRGNASKSSLPGGSSTSGSPDRITFDRAELDAALRGFTTETASIAGEGAKAVEALDNAKAWAQSH